MQLGRQEGLVSDAVVVNAWEMSHTLTDRQRSAARAADGCLSGSTSRSVKVIEVEGGKLAE